MKKIFAAAGLVLSLGFGGLALAGPATADEVGTPTDTAQVVTETPTVESTTPVEAQKPVSEPNVTPSELPKSTSPDPVTEVTPVSTEPVQETKTAPVVTYHAAIWEGALNLQPKFPQALVHDGLTTSTDVHQFDSFATKCGTTYQFDLYADDAKTTALVTKGVLNGGDESWPASGQVYNVFTTPACTVTTIEVGPLAVNPPTCDTAGLLPLTSWPAAQNPNGYEGDGFRVYLNKAYTGPGTYIATVQKVGPGFDAKYPKGTKVVGLLSQTLVVLPATGVTQSTDASAACYVAPPVAGEKCTFVGGAYTESDDHAPADIADGKSFVSQGDKTPVEFGYPTNGNLQGFTGINWTDKDVVGNGIFFRFVVDLTGDGLGGYNSLSITDHNVTQASVANVGSKNVFLGKTIAEIAAAYPHNKITSIHWQTGSSYAKGDGATLVAAKGDCFDLKYAKPPVVEPPVVVTPTTPAPVETIAPVVVKTTPVPAEVLASTGASSNTNSTSAIALGIFIFGVILFAASVVIRRRSMNR